MSGSLRSSPWFTQWFASRPQHERAGIGATLVRFGAGIEAISGHSGIGKLEGLNLLAIAGDEVDEFESQRWLEMGIGSSASRFGTKRKVISMGWPRYPNSPIQAARREGRKAGHSHKVLGPLPSWKVNPLITGDTFADVRRDNPALFDARFRCRPRPSLRPVYPDPAVIVACVKDEDAPRLSVGRYVRDGGGWEAVVGVGSRLRPVRGSRCWRHI